MVTPEVPQPESIEGASIVEGTMLAPMPEGETLEAQVWYKVINADKKGDPVLMFHGGPGIPSTDLEADIEALMTLDRPVIIYDQLGCGNSKLPGQGKKPGEEGYQDYSHLWTIDRFVDEGAAIWEHLKERFGYERVHLYGLSWGTKLALELILRDKIKPEEIGSVTFAGPVFNEEMFKRDVSDLYLLLGNRIGFGDRAQERQRELEEAGDFHNPDYIAIWENGFERRHILGKALSEFRPDVRSKLEESITPEKLGHEVLEVMLGSLANYTGNLQNYDRLDNLHEVSEKGIPTLITVGRNDEVTPTTARHFHELMPGSEFEIFEDSAHMPHITEPVRYFARLNDFLQRADARRQAA